jgi:DNA (cytosine-5)-methyltransferase 1
MSSDITVTDLFCGAGGSSTGLTAAGANIRMAANHWKLAIETHSTNHPDTDHDCADLRQTHPALYPKTTMLWASPECTSHSLAKGKKRKNVHQLDLWGNSAYDPAEERSRATMREVVEFAEYHRYEIIIVENVVDIRYWTHYEDWLQAMHNLGYEHKALYLNAQFFGVPQSRDRVYIVFWKRGNRKPDLDFRVRSICEKHGEVEAFQSFKKAGYEWGRYGSRRQYVYRCPQCHQEVKPYHVPAAQVIDWALPIPRIGDRDKPLKPKTLDRIKSGLAKFGYKSLLVDTGWADSSSGHITPTDTPMPTQTTRQTVALVSNPFMVSYYNNELSPRNVDEPMYTVATRSTPSLVIPPAFITSVNHGTERSKDAADPLPAVMPQANPALVLMPFLTTIRGDLAGSGLDEPLKTIVAAGSQQWLTLPFIATLRQSAQYRGLDESLSSITAGGNNHALIFNYSNPDLRSPELPLDTITTVDHTALIEPEKMIDDCGFRMLQPHELKRGMSFPDEYIVLGNKRDQVRQIGNAVCCNVAQVIAERCIASLA